LHPGRQHPHPPVLTFLVVADVQKEREVVRKDTKNAVGGVGAVEKAAGERKLM